MNPEKSIGPIRILSESNGAETKTELPVLNDGARIKRLQYFLIIDKQSSSNASFAVDVFHGPDGRNMAHHSFAIAHTTCGSVPKVLEGTVSDSTIMIGPFVHAYVYIKDTREVGAEQQWAEITVYVAKKPI